MPKAGFKPAIAANERPQTYSLDRDHRNGQNNKYFTQYIVLFSSCFAHVSFMNPSTPPSVHCMALEF